MTVAYGMQLLAMSEASADTAASCKVRWFEGSEIFLNRLASQRTESKDLLVDLTAEDTARPLTCSGELSLEDLVAGRELQSVLVASYGMNREDVLTVFGHPETLTLVDQYDNVREEPGVEQLVGDGTAYSGWTLVRPMFEQGPAYKGKLPS